MMVAPVLLKFSHFYLLTFFFDRLRLCQLYWLTVIELVFLRFYVDVIRTLRLCFAVVVDLQVAALDFLAIHLYKSRFCAFVSLVLDVGESF